MDESATRNDVNPDSAENAAESGEKSGHPAEDTADAAKNGRMAQCRYDDSMACMEQTRENAFFSTPNLWDSLSSETMNTLWDRLLGDAAGELGGAGFPGALLSGIACFSVPFGAFAESTTVDTRPKRVRILEMLRNASGGWISGKVLAAELGGISRAAINKHIAALKRDGHIIESGTNRGYRLLAEADNFTLDNVLAGMKTQIFGADESRWVWKYSTASTNRDAAMYALGGAQEGYVFVAQNQIDGRGRLGHKWLSLPRSLSFSLLLRPVQWMTLQRINELGLLATAAGVRVCCGLNLDLLEPNDFYLNGKKAGGVLVEGSYRGSDIECAVLGIGLNVNACPQDFPVSLRSTATSLYAESGKIAPRDRLLQEILHAFEILYVSESEELRERYRG